MSERLQTDETPDWLGPATDLLKQYGLDEAADRLARAVTQAWISVDDRKPADSDNVLVYWGGDNPKVVGLGCWNPENEEWWDCDLSYYANDAATHWMPLLEPPR